MGKHHGREKCENIKIGKEHRNSVIYIGCNADAWKDIIIKDDIGKNSTKDKYIGKEVMTNLEEKNISGSNHPKL